MAGVSWVSYIADLMRRGADAELTTAWQRMYAEWGSQAHDMWCLAKAEAAKADQAAEPVQTGLW